MKHHATFNVNSFSSLIAYYLVRLGVFSVKCSAPSIEKTGMYAYNFVYSVLILYISVSLLGMAGKH